MNDTPRATRISLLTALALAVLGTTPIRDAEAAFTFEKIADRSTPVPGGGAIFVAYRVPALDGDDVAFQGIDDGGGRGIYKRVGGTLQTVADLGSAIPNGVGTFSALDSPSLDSGVVAFRAIGSGGQSGIYTDVAGLTQVADESTTVPFFGGSYSSFGLWPSIEGGQVVFSAVGAVSAERGIYSWNGALSTLADSDFGIPGGTGEFTSFFDPTLRDGAVGFVASGSGQEGVYRLAGGAFTLIANRDTLQPGESVEFGDFAAFGSVDGSEVAFFGVSNAPRRGVYRGGGASLAVVADTETAIPDGVGTFSTFAFTPDSGPSVECGVTVFVGEGSGGQKGIYQERDGVLAKVIAVGDTLGGLSVDNVFVSREALSEGRTLFGTNEPGGSTTSIDAIWLATDSAPNPCGLDAVPSFGSIALGVLVVCLVGSVLHVPFTSWGTDITFPGNDDATR